MHRTSTLPRHIKAVAALLPCLAMPPSFAQAPVLDNPSIERQVDSMLAKLTVEQKIELIGGAEGMTIRSEPASGFPQLRMSDGPVGVRTWGASTAYAAGIALAATWDPALALRVGTSLGKDARARGVHFLLGPGVNIYRAPMNGRNFEYFGEDPYLAARTTVAYVEGVQSQGVVATIKHFALNNQEYDRHGVSSDADERTIREIYLPAFEAAVREAHIGAVMNSYNLINGVHATQNGWLNNEVLKRDWDFDGILMSDWAATYDGVAAANNGLDLEMPSGDFMNKKALLPAMQRGVVTQATIDDKIRRIYRTAIRFGFLDRPQQDFSTPLYSQEGRQVALDEARESIVMLKNEDHLLPLDPAKMHFIAVIGPDAWPAVTGGGGSSHATPFSAVSILTGISNTGAVKVLYAGGLPSIEDLFSQTKFVSLGGIRNGDGPNIKLERFDNPSFKGKPSSVSQVERIDSWRADVWTPGIEVTKSIRYSATYIPEKDGEYLFVVAATAADSYELFVDDKQILAEAVRENQAPKFTRLVLKADKPISVRLDYPLGAAEPRVGLGIRAVDGLVSPEALEMAAQADAVVVAVGYKSAEESEGFDRSFSLPFGQDALIDAISQVNKKTIVTITAGGEVDTRRWLRRIPVLLHNWYPGQEGGTALAEILFGTRSPEGKLPISFARSWDENPTHDNYYALPVPDGKTPHVTYSEGVFLGYRYYTSEDKSPLFPFGFGLTYTTFRFSDIQVSPANPGTDDSVTVKFNITNIGHREGTDVAQVYVGDPSAIIRRPVKELKGFQKVRLNPGESQRVTLTLDRRSLSYWDMTIHKWRLDPGRFIVYVGDSSEDTPLRSEFTVHGI